ncbi:hypothetical protein KDL29_09295 [bacterium]|nr:hypothetical protein [bacterium]
MIGWQRMSDFFVQHFGEEPEIACCAPGRINLIGEHIDYAGGQVLPLSISLGVSVAVRATRQGLLRVVSDEYPDAGIVTLDGSLAQDGPAGYVLELARTTETTSAQIAILSDLPVGQGLSSSAAIGIAVQCALLALKPDAVMPSARAVCRAAQRAEHLALGTSCGIMDQYASMFGSPGNAILIDTWQETHHAVPLDSLAGCCIILVDSGQPRELSASQYNQRHAEMTGTLNEAKRLCGGFNCFREKAHDELLAIAEAMPEPANRRMRHLLMEQRRVGRFQDGLRERDLKMLGRILYAGHCSLRDDAEVSTPQIDTLVEMLCSTPGCLGARLMGGGFGGSVLALFESPPDEFLMAGLLRDYAGETTLGGRWLQVEPGPGAWLQSGRGSWRSVAEWL